MSVSQSNPPNPMKIECLLFVFDLLFSEFTMVPTKMQVVVQVWIGFKASRFGLSLRLKMGNRNWDEAFEIWVSNWLIIKDEGVSMSNF